LNATPLQAVVAGHICLDIIPDMSSVHVDNFQEFFHPGRLVQVGAASMCTGGPVSNTGLALHRLGVPTRLIGKVGKDAFGEMVRNIVASYDPELAAGLLTDPGTSTSYSVIFSPPSVDRLILHNPGANHTFSPDDVDYAFLAQSDTALFHFGYPPVMRGMYAHNGRGLVELFRRAKNTDVTTSLDMCYPEPASEGGQADWLEILKATLPYVDIFLPSIEELLLMLHPAIFAELVQQGSLMAQVTPGFLHDLSDELLSMGACLAVVKLGERGLYLRSAGESRFKQMGRACPSNLSAWAGRELWAPCFQVQVAGTTGAGDATIAGFLSALLRDQRLEEAVVLAVAVGACNVEAPDALSGLRSWEDTTQRIHAGWERLPLKLDEPGWEWDAACQLWRKGDNDC
jgi:sugar/nucleoside kinase (ribokinase family)